MSPAYFGLVMATRIVSLAADMMDMASLAQGLFQLNMVLYAALLDQYGRHGDFDFDRRVINCPCCGSALFGFDSGVS